MILKPVFQLLLVQRIPELFYKTSTNGSFIKLFWDGNYFKKIIVKINKL